jgi:murein DD-endopeptidase MepM/ murein hydrolase activator NlpD
MPLIPKHRLPTGMPRARLLAAGIAALMVGCATTDSKFGDQTWYQDTKQASTKAVEVTTTAATKAAQATAATASKAYDRMQKYLAEKDLLKTFHDSGEHSEVALLSVLHKSGIAKSPAAPAPGAAAPAPGAAQPKPHTVPLPPLNPAVPEQYSGALRWPLDAGIVSSEYGERWGKMHKGLDIAADVGEPVYAIADGEVIYAGDGMRGYGNVVILRHDRKMSSLYAHNSELKVKVGDQVKQGTVVSLLGNTGHSTGPHVHFEIREGDVAVSPRTVLPKSKLADVIDQRQSDTRAVLAAAAKAPAAPPM